MSFFFGDDVRAKVVDGVAYGRSIGRLFRPAPEQDAADVGRGVRNFENVSCVVENVVRQVSIAVECSDVHELNFKVKSGTEVC